MEFIHVPFFLTTGTGYYWLIFCQSFSDLDFESTCGITDFLAVALDVVNLENKNHKLFGYPKKAQGGTARDVPELRNEFMGTQCEGKGWNPFGAILLRLQGER